MIEIILTLLPMLIMRARFDISVALPYPCLLSVPLGVSI
jgi:hypothetical protein